MSTRSRVKVPVQLSLARRRQALAIAAVIAACGWPATPPARAAVEGGGGAGQGTRPLPPATALTVAFPQPHGAEVAAQSPGTTAGPALPMEARPSNAANGYLLGGSIFADWGASGIDIGVGSISNQSGSTSGTLQLQLWATARPPVFGDKFTFYSLGPAYTLGTLKSGSQFTNVNTGVLSPYAPPPNGCYFVTVALTDLTSGTYLDLLTFNLGGVPNRRGFGVPDDSCAGSGGSCTSNANTACLVGGRFQARVSFVNASGSGNATVMSFGGTRAESDESVFLYFTDASNFEMGLKVLPACGINNRYWVFIGGLTNQGWTVNIVDTETGHAFTYSNPLNHLTSTTADTTGGPPCP